MNGGVASARSSDAATESPENAASTSLTWSATSWQRYGKCGELALRVAVDTNVWVSGLILPGSIPGRIVQAVRNRKLEVVISWELAAELRDVLGRSKLRDYEVSGEDVRDLLSDRGIRMLTPAKITGAS